VKRLAFSPFYLVSPPLQSPPEPLFSFPSLLPYLCFFLEPIVLLTGAHTLHNNVGLFPPPPRTLPFPPSSGLPIVLPFLFSVGMLSSSDVENSLLTPRQNNFPPSPPPPLSVPFFSSYHAFLFPLLCTSQFQFNSDARSASPFFPSLLVLSNPRPL